MLPPQFAAGSPQRFTLSEQFDDLRARYACLGPSDTLTWVFKHVEDQGATDALLEHEYVDSDYRDEYANFYIKVFRNLPDRCERLHFWTGQRYLGYVSIRPIAGQPVCRTMLDPGDDLADSVSCAIRASAHPYGTNLEVPAFPFISQDRQYGRCAHAVLWMVSHYHHVLNDTPSRTMSDIVGAASETETERVVPSRGLTEEQVGSTLRRIGLPAVKYKIVDQHSIAHQERSVGTDAVGDAGKVSGVDENGELLNSDEVERLVIRYLNSRIPVILGTPGHLTALIGARRNEGVLEVIRCDDERGAYCPHTLAFAKGPERSMVLFVPLPGRIYLLGEDVEVPAREALRALLDRDQAQRGVFDGRTVRFREYVVDSRDYKASLASRNLPGRTAEAHVQVGCPRWIWIVEVQDEVRAEVGQPCCLGEIAIDATSDSSHPNFLFGNLPGLRASWRPHESDPDVVAEPWQDSPYISGTALGL